MIGENLGNVILLVILSEMFNIFREFFKKPKETVVIAQLVDEK